MMMLTVLGCEEGSGGTKVYRGSCGVNPTVTGERCGDLSQSKPEIIQAMPGVITVGHLAMTNK